MACRAGCRRGPQVAGTGELAGCGVGSSTSQEAGRVFAARCSAGSNLAAAWATRRSVMTGRSRFGWRACRRPTGHRPWGGVGSVGRPGGPARRGSGQAAYAFPELRVAVDLRSRTSAIRVRAAAGETPIATASDSGAKAATCGVRRRRGSRRRRARRAPAAGCLDAGVVGGGVQDRPLVGELEAEQLAPRISRSRCVARASTPAGSRSPTSCRSSGAALIGLAKHRPPTVEGLRSPYPQGF